MVTLAEAVTGSGRNFDDTRHVYCPECDESALSSDSVRFHGSLNVCPTPEFSMATSSLNQSVSKWYRGLHQRQNHVISS